MYIEKIVKGKKRKEYVSNAPAFFFQFRFSFFCILYKNNGIQKLKQNLPKFSQGKKIVKESMHGEEL